MEVAVSYVPPNPRYLGEMQQGRQFGGPEDAPCLHCGHRDGAHRRPGSCSVRGRWLRRCRCNGYEGLDAAAPGE
jgi:hypothetical protein